MDENEFIMKATESILVSLVIPVYNAEGSIRKCIDSALAQTYSNIEIICVNDCSKDTSLHILCEYEQKDNRIHVINHEENKNAGGARNSGIKAASGEYVYFLDNDDWLREDAIEILVGASNNAFYDVVSSGYSRIYKDGHAEPLQNYILGNSIEDNIVGSLNGHCSVFGTLFRKNMIVKNEIFFPEKMFWEDNAISVCFILYAKTINVIPDDLYRYYVGNEQSSSRFIFYGKILDRVKSTDYFLENVKKRGFYESHAKMYDYRWMFFTRYTIELLGDYPWGKTKDTVLYLANRIQSMLPNPYFNEFDENTRTMLLDPERYVKRKNKEHRIQKVKSFFHSIRHSIVEMLKKIPLMKKLFNKITKK